MPQNVTFFDVVVVYCINSRRESPLLKKKANHPHYPGLWGFPAGKVEPGEDFVRAATRELFEETGNKKDGYIVSLDICYPTLHHSHSTGSGFYFYSHMMFCVSPIEEIIIDGNEHEKGLLVSIDDILAKTKKFDLIPDALDNFRDSIKFLSSLK